MWKKSIALNEHKEQQQNDKFLFAWNNPIFSDRLLKLYVTESQQVDAFGSDAKEEKTPAALTRTSWKRTLTSLESLSSPAPSSKRRKTSTAAPRKIKRPKWTASAVRAWKKPLDTFLKDHPPNLALNTETTNLDESEEQKEAKDKDETPPEQFEIYVSSMLLAKHSSMFRAMFSSKFIDSKQDQIKIGLESAEHIRAFIHAMKFLYTSTLPKSFNEQSLLYLFMIAVQFDIPALLDISTQRLADCLTLQNYDSISRLLHLLDNITLVELPNRAIQDKLAELLVENWRRFYMAWKDPRFLKLPFIGLVLILENKHKLHYATENSMYQILRQWILANSPSTDQLSKLTEYIHWPNISASFFLDIVKQDVCFKSLPHWNEFLQNVQEFMLLQRPNSQARSRQEHMLQQGKLSYVYFCAAKLDPEHKIPRSPSLTEKEDMLMREDQMFYVEDMDTCLLDVPTRVFADGYFLYIIFFKTPPDANGNRKVKSCISMDTERTGISIQQDYYVDGHWRWEFFMPDSKEEQVPELNDVHFTLSKGQPRQPFEHEWPLSVIHLGPTQQEIVTCVRRIWL